MIRLTVSLQDVSLVNKICSASKFNGKTLEPHIETVEKVGSFVARQNRVEQAFKLLVQERYNPATFCLNLDSVSNHPDPARCIDWSNVDSGKALCTTLQRFCTGCKEIILDNNDLSNLSIFNGIARACPTVESLSLAGNKVKEFTQFRFINNLRLRALRIARNPIAELDAKLRLDEAKKYFNRLEILDGTPTNMMRFFDPVCELPMAKGSFMTPEMGPIAQAFVSNFLSKLTNRATPVEELAAMYDGDAYMSLSLASDSQLKQSHIGEFQKVNRNLCRDSSSKVVKDYLFIGPEKISQAIKNLPFLTVPPEMLVCDAIDMTPFSQMQEVKTAGVRFIQLCFCGSASLDGENFTIRRVFTLLLASDRLFIRNDMMTILPELGKNIALDTNMVMNVTNKEELITRVSLECRVVPQVAREALDNCQGNPDAAIQLLNQMREQNRIPPHLCT